MGFPGENRLHGKGDAPSKVAAVLRHGYNILLDYYLHMEKINRLLHHADSFQEPFPRERNKDPREPIVTDNFCGLSDIRAREAKLLFSFQRQVPYQFHATLVVPFESQALKIERAESTRYSSDKEKKGENLTHGQPNRAVIRVCEHPKRDTFTSQH